MADLNSSGLLVQPVQPIDWMAEQAKEISHLRSELEHANRVIGLLEEEKQDLTEECDKLDQLGRDAYVQLEYLHSKFQPTGSGEAVLARLANYYGPYLQSSQGGAREGKV